MRNGLKKVMALVLTLMMILSLVPATVFADTTDSNTVVVKAPVAPQSEGDEQEIYSIVINYVFADGSQAANPWTATIAKGSSYAANIQSPTVVGYTADQAVVNVNVTDIQENKTYTVTYSPAEVNFTVKHYLQNVDDDKYTLANTETKQGYTEAAVGDALKNTTDYDGHGFTALLYDTTTKIAADGSTEVEIYYDRNYYLLSLDLKGGYGADPVYARFGATINIDDPQKSGYTFGGWEPSKPDTMPAKDMTLTAQWTAGQATYQVQYWQENANDDGYSFVEQVKKTANAGDIVNGSNDKSYVGFTYFQADANVTVNGDGSTVVNVYYKRNVYEVKFFSDRNGQIEDTSRRITAKYGAFIGKRWPGGSWYVGTSDSTAQTYLAVMPLNGKNFYGQQTGNNTSTATYYVEVLPGETGTTTVTVGSRTYKFHHQDSANHGWGSLQVTDEERYEIEGFTCNASISTKNGYNYNGAKFYYDRNSYKLKYNDQYGTQVSEELPFEQVLSESVNHKNNYVPAYPATLEEGAYRFVGWYTDPGCKQPVDWNAKMPAASVVLYAYWAPVKHTVTFAKNEGEEPEHSENVAHGSTASGYTTTNGNYTFIGWFYKENGVEKAYTTSMQIRKKLDLYAKWRSDAILPYTIYYKLEDGTVIATETTGSALAGATKTFDAKAGDQLNEGYRTGYFPQTNSHSLTMDIDGNNEFTFIYVPMAKVKYTVRYLDKATGEPVVVNGVPTPDKNDETSSAVITETFKQITGYAPDAYQKRLVLSANEKENVLIFWYEKDNVHAPVQIIHWTQNIAGDGYTEYQSSTKLDGVIGQSYSESPLNIPGFAYKANTSNASGILTAEGLVLNLYYDRIEYPYEFRFLEQGTDKVLADPVTGNARYQAQVTQTAKVIPGYTLVSQENQAMNIAIEDPANVANKNVRTFYYTESEVTIKYEVAIGTGTVTPTAETLKAVTGTATGSLAKPGSNYRFEGWYKDAACTDADAVPAEWVVNGKIIPVKKENEIWVDGTTYYAKFVLNEVKIELKKVVSGNFGDKSKFFTINAAWDGKTQTYYIKNADPNKFELSALVNTVLTLTEECEGYAASAICKVGNDTIATASVVYAEAATKKNPTLTFNFSAEGKQLTGDAEITITNHKEAHPDTGVLLDSLPYILIIACVAAIGAFIVIRRRKNRED